VIGTEQHCGVSGQLQGLTVADRREGSRRDPDARALFVFIGAEPATVSIAISACTDGRICGGFGLDGEGQGLNNRAVPAPRYWRPSGVARDTGAAYGSRIADGTGWLNRGLTDLTGLCHVAASRLGGLTAYEWQDPPGGVGEAAGSADL
jgi:hypothetical protein